MTELHVQGAALIAMLVSLPLVSWGSTSGIPALTVIGTVLLVAGLVAQTVLRFIDTPDTQEET